jgi:hypothetical protein
MPVGFAALLGLVVLGPALGPGLVLSYDLVWSPDARVTPFALGVGTPAPRAVPSDAVAVVLGVVLTPAVAQKAALLGLIVLAGTGAWALLRAWQPGAGWLAGAVATTLAVWNPFVAERLVIGQWTVLLGYAVLPWLLRAVTRVRGGTGSALAVAGWVLLAAAGGAHAWVMVAPVAIVLLLFPAPRWRPLAVAASAAVGGCAAWALPALLGSVRGDVGGFRAFAARADSPTGLAPSLLGGGGLWNPAAVPPEREVTVLAVAAAAILVAGVWTASARGGSTARVAVALAVVGVGLAAMSGIEGLAGAWDLLAQVPGGSLLRDSQKLVGPWVVVGAAGLGALADLVGRRPGWGQAAAVGLLVVTPLLTPSLAWGAGGRLDAVTVPADLRAAAARLSADGAGEVGLLPWRQYRRYAWNADRVSLSLVPRMVDAQVLFDDSLPLSTGRVAGEDPRASRVSAAIEGGGDPWTALAREGVRRVVVEKQVGLDDVPPPPAGTTVLLDDAHVRVVDLGPGAGTDTTSGPPAALQVGWAVTLVTAVLWVLGLATRRLPLWPRRQVTRW